MDIHTKREIHKELLDGISDLPDFAKYIRDTVRHDLASKIEPYMSYKDSMDERSNTMHCEAMIRISPETMYEVEDPYFLTGTCRLCGEALEKPSKYCPECGAYFKNVIRNKYGEYGIAEVYYETGGQR